ENPLIKAYYEDRWAELPDSRGPIEPSLNMLQSLHEKWVYLLKGTTPEKLSRSYMHPESGENILKNVIGMYAWHGNHHFTHIQSLAKREGWIYSSFAFHIGGQKICFPILKRKNNEAV